MKKLELVGIVLAAAAVVFGVLNGGTDAAAAGAFVPVALLAALQRKPYTGAWQFTRGLTLGAGILGAIIAVLGFGLLAGMLRAAMPISLFISYFAATFCSFVLFAMLLAGAEEITRTGMYRSARIHVRS